MSIRALYHTLLKLPFSIFSQHMISKMIGKIAQRISASLTMVTSKKGLVRSRNRLLKSPGEKETYYTFISFSLH